MELGVGLRDPCGSLLSWGILLFYGFMAVRTPGLFNKKENEIKSLSFSYTRQLRKFILTRDRIKSCRLLNTCRTSSSASTTRLFSPSAELALSSVFYEIC